MSIIFKVFYSLWGEKSQRNHRSQSNRSFGKNVEVSLVFIHFDDHFDYSFCNDKIKNTIKKLDLENYAQG